VPKKGFSPSAVEFSSERLCKKYFAAAGGKILF
jgi:hypothetical protein